MTTLDFGIATIRTVRLANQLLALARAEPGGRSEPLAPMDLKTVVEGVIVFEAATKDDATFFADAYE